jgi:hypothetical protein
MNDPRTLPSPANLLRHGRTTLAASNVAQRLISRTTYPASVSVRVENLSTNAAVIQVGDATLALAAPGGTIPVGATVDLDIDHQLADLYVMGTINDIATFIMLGNV